MNGFQKKPPPCGRRPNAQAILSHNPPNRQGEDWKVIPKTQPKPIVSWGPLFEEI
jgi:hypothetical protein